VRPASRADSAFAASVSKFAELFPELEGDWPAAVTAKPNGRARTAQKAANFTREKLPIPGIGMTMIFQSKI
jgi:hypothetical protein